MPASVRLPVIRAAPTPARGCSRRTTPRTVRWRASGCPVERSTRRRCGRSPDCAEDLGDGRVHLTSRGNLQLRGLSRASDLAARLTARRACCPRRRTSGCATCWRRRCRGSPAARADVRGLAAELRPRAVRTVRGWRGCRDGSCSRWTTVAVTWRPRSRTSAGARRARRPGSCWSLGSRSHGSASPTRWQRCSTPRRRSWRCGQRTAERRGGPRSCPTRPPGSPPRSRLARPCVRKATFPACGAGKVAFRTGAASLPGPVRRDDGGIALVVAAVLGELTADQVRLLADDRPPRRRHARGAPSCCPDPRLPVEQLAAAGLLVAPGPAATVSACAGRPGCAKSLADVRPTRARPLAHLPDARMHVSGCPRRCGAPRAVHVDALALPDGGYLVDGDPPPRARSDDPRLRPRRRRDLPPVVRHDPRRGRPVPAPGRRRSGGGADDPRLRSGGPRRRHRLLPRPGRRRLARRCGTAPRSSATPRWSPPASRGPACPPATTSSAPCAIPRSPVSPSGSAPPARAAALELWRERLAGAVVAIGNAPTALFHLLDMIDGGAPRPAAVLGIPVGFIGAAESKDELAARDDLAYLVVHGRRGGSAITAAAVNALATEQEILSAPTARAPLYGVGVGPGDPELVTVKAARLIAAADVIAYHSARHGRSIARRIAAAPPARRPDRGGAGLPGHHRDHRPPRRLPGRDRRVLRRGRRAAGRTPGRRPRRRRARRGRPALLRLLHAHAQAPRAPLPDRGRPGRHVDQRGVGGTRPAAGGARRGADGAARHPVPHGAGPAARRHRLRRRAQAGPNVRRRSATPSPTRDAPASTSSSATMPDQRTAALADVDPGSVPYFAIALLPGAVAASLPAPEPADLDAPVDRRGEVVVVGTGPAGRDWLTPQVAAALAAADDLVGYGPYLARVPPNPRQTRHPATTGSRRSAPRTPWTWPRPGARSPWCRAVTRACSRWPPPCWRSRRRRSTSTSRCACCRRSRRRARSRRRSGHRSATTTR